jgi:hypothetical protein
MAKKTGQLVVDVDDDEAIAMLKKLRDDEDVRNAIETNPRQGLKRHLDIRLSERTRVGDAARACHHRRSRESTGGRQDQREGEVRTPLARNHPPLRRPRKRASRSSGVGV